ncbi:MAG: hypothetical protein Q4E59_00870 [Bacteroidales bacterium]|nr:hypothetical protein [Bacteroidales bacterium]
MAQHIRSLMESGAIGAEVLCSEKRQSWEAPADVDAWMDTCCRAVLRMDVSGLDTDALCPYARLLTLMMQWTEGRMPHYPDLDAVQGALRKAQTEVQMRSCTERDCRRAYLLGEAALGLRQTLNPICDDATADLMDRLSQRAGDGVLPAHLLAASRYRQYLAYGDEACLAESRAAAARMFAALPGDGAELVDLLYTLWPVYQYDAAEGFPTAESVARVCSLPTTELSPEKLQDACTLKRLYVAFAYLEEKSVCHYQDDLLEVMV